MDPIESQILHSTAEASAQTVPPDEEGVFLYLKMLEVHSNRAN